MSAKWVGVSRELGRGREKEKEKETHSRVSMTKIEKAFRLVTNGIMTSSIQQLVTKHTSLFPVQD